MTRRNRRPGYIEPHRRRHDPEDTYRRSIRHQLAFAITFATVIVLACALALALL